MIWYFKYGKATGKGRHFLTSHDREGKYPLPAANHIQKQEKHPIYISSPKLVSTTALTNDQYEPTQKKPGPRKKKS